MKFSLSWLQDHIDLDPKLSLDDLVELMTMAGLEVEHVDDPAARLAEFSVAHVIEAGPHPDADKLRVCRVATKDGEKQIVCGAPNARTGLYGIYAPLGTFIPGLGFALDKKPRKIRGVESHGMLCSVKELEVGDDHDGIIELDGEWEIGAPAAEALGVSDAVIDFEVTPNRPDWLGVKGIARDLAACGAGTFKDEPVAPVPGAFALPVGVTIEDEAFCPAFGLRLIRGVKNGPSPEWMQKRLRAIGLRPINALVDVTNYMTFDRARPLHVFDAAKTKGDLAIRRAKKGESLLALDERTYELDENIGVIIADGKVESLAGLMGGEETGCSAETTDVLVEAALWDPLTIARAGRKLGLVSDAQYRFARGVDPNSVEEGLEMATRLILDMCGGEASEVLVEGEIPSPPPDVDFPPTEIKRLSGLDLKRDKVISILESLGFGVDAPKGAKSWAVSVPSWRADVEGKACLVEEVVRVYGYDKLDAVALPRPEGRRPPAMRPERRRIEHARRTLAQRGLMEAITWSFCLTAHAKLFGGDGSLRLANPISAEIDCMRPSPLPHLLQASQRNADRGQLGAALMEVGPIYRTAAPDGQEWVAAGVRRPPAARHWQGAAETDVYDVKADALAALEAAGAPIANLQTAAPASVWWHPGRSGVLQLGPKVRLAEFGELHPSVLKALDVDGPVYGFEVYLDAIPAPRAKGRSKGALEASDLMPVTRDFAFVVDADKTAGELIRAAAGADKALIDDVSVFDVFEGASLGEGKKSIAIEVRLQPRDATLDEKALEAVSKKIVAAVAKATGAVLRS